MKNENCISRKLNDVVIRVNVSEEECELRSNGS